MGESDRVKGEWLKLVEEVNALTPSPDKVAIDLLQYLSHADMYQLLCLATYLNALWVGIFPKEHEVNVAAREIKKVLIQYHYLGRPWENKSDGLQPQQILSNESGELSEDSPREHEGGKESSKIQSEQRSEVAEGTEAGDGS